MTDTDGVDETFEHTLRTALMAAARAGEMLARLREQQQRHAEARSRQEAAELQARFRAEQTAARAVYEQARYPDWWDRAILDDIVATYQTAAAWSDVDPQADAAMRHIEREAKTRYDVELGTPASAMASTAEHAAAEAGHQAARARREELEATDLLAAAAAADRDSDRAAATGDPAEAAHDQHMAADLTTQAVHVYDSAERRQHDAERLTSVADAATAEARVRADTSQAQPATQATRSKPPARSSRGTRARPSQRQRTPASRGR